MVAPAVRQTALSPLGSRFSGCRKSDAPSTLFQYKGMKLTDSRTDFMV
jgi:hypothetical protein